MSIVLTEKERKIARESGRRLSAVLYKVIQKVSSGVTPRELNRYAEELIKEGGDEPSFLGYKPYDASYPVPVSLFVSVNNEVVHALNLDQVIKDGDLVSLDLGLKHKGFMTDMARTIAIGNIDEKGKRLIDVTREGLAAGIKVIRAGCHVGDIGAAVEAIVTKGGFSVVEELGGHGVGEKVHEPPYIQNFGPKGEGPVLVEGAVIAIEPVVNEGKGDVVLDKDGYTFRTKDGKRSAHFEDTVLVTKKGAEILTRH